MSRSEPNTHAENPATRFLDWTGGDGKLVYYDRVQKINIEVALPFRFLVLDEVATVGGGIDEDGQYKGYFSNSIRPLDAKSATFTVRSSQNGKTRVEATGTWADIKGMLTGAKYVKGLYIAFNDADGNLQLGYLKIRGAALGPWIDLLAEHKDIYAGAYAITDKEAKKKGTNNYFAPVITFTDNVKEETAEAAFALDAEILQPYLKAYFAQRAMAATNEGMPTHSGAFYEDEPEMPGGNAWEPPVDEAF